jgi:hypothetical protein
VAEHVGQPHGVDLGNWRRAVDNSWLTPAVPALVQPDCDATGLDVNQVRNTVAIYIAKKDTLGIEAQSTVS